MNYKPLSVLQLVYAQGSLQPMVEKCWSGAEMEGRVQDAWSEVVGYVDGDRRLRTNLVEHEHEPRVLHLAPAPRPACHGPGSCRTHQARAAQRRPRRRPCAACGCRAHSSCRSRQRLAPTQRTGCRAWWQTLLATQSDERVCSGSSLLLRAVGCAAKTGRNGSVARLASKLDGDGRTEYLRYRLCDKACAPRLDAFECQASARLAALPCATTIGCVLLLRGRFGFF
ncbi:hypothetical protein EDB83DRAFT_1009939 [Lactarius deliciosus]|nr:hypothetical protein EDB83DRAFT_1009939 [Lactarius deliciosus]